MKPCKFCGSPAIEQVRGTLTADDKGYVAPRGIGARANSNNPANATDTRIACSNTKLAMRSPAGPIKIDADARAWNLSYSGEGFIFPLCDNQTGWNKAEQADYTRFLWDRDHGA
jgi:hypothetical protein